jgi:hypothetical protein
MTTALLILGFLVLLAAVLLSIPRPTRRGTGSQIVKRQTDVARRETPMDVRARAARIEDDYRKSRPALTSKHYPGLTVRSEIEIVNGEVVEDPQLAAGSPQQERLLGGPRRLLK